jgi:hypothetical protein
MKDELFIEGFGVETHINQQIHYHRADNVDTISLAFESVMVHYKPWGAGRIKLINLKPRLTMISESCRTA